MDRVILVTNDDGIGSEGLKVLADHLREIGRVFVIAPAGEMSATGHSFSAFRPLRVKFLDPQMVAVDGTPTDCVMLGLKCLLPRKPDLLVSGINRGPNMGDDVTYSGTVAAAAEGALQGVSSFAVSIAARDGFQFLPAARFAVRLARTILSNGLPARTLLNVNVPHDGEVKGVRITRQGKRIYRDRMKKEVDKEGRVHYSIIAGEPGWEREEGTDFMAIEKGMISVTPLQSDLTCYGVMEELGRWNLEP